MRNLKRALSLALASVMLMGMMVVGTSAASANSFTDADEISNKEAVAIATGLGIFDGYTDGSFGPTKAVTRAEAAVVIAKILHGSDVNPANLAGAGKFTDVPAWAEGYVNLVAALKIIEGRGAGIFDPSATVTTVEYTTMLLKALGYYVDAETALDADWKLEVTSKANALGLYGDLELGMNAPLTRENVAELTFNALFAQRVAYNDYRGQYVKATDRDVVVTNGTIDDMNTLAQNTFGLYSVEGIVTANGMTDEALSKTLKSEAQTTVVFTEDTDLNQDGKVEYAEGEEYDFEVETGLDMIGHAAKVYYKIVKKAPVVFAIVDQATKVEIIDYNANTTKLAKAANDAGFKKNTILDVAVADYIINYDMDTTYADKAVALDTLIVISNTSNNEVDYVIALDQYLDKVASVEEDDDEIVYELNYADGTDMNVATYAADEDDFVIVTDIGNQGEILVFEPAEVVSADITKIAGISDNNSTVKKVIADGETYTKSTVLNRVASEFTAFDAIQTIGEANLVLDQFGKLIGLAFEKAIPNYAYVAQFGERHSTSGLNTNTVLTAHVFFADGTDGIYEVDTNKSSAALTGKTLATLNGTGTPHQAQGGDRGIYNVKVLANGKVDIDTLTTDVTTSVAADDVKMLKAHSTLLDANNANVVFNGENLYNDNETIYFYVTGSYNDTKANGTGSENTLTVKVVTGIKNVIKHTNDVGVKDPTINDTTNKAGTGIKEAFATINATGKDFIDVMLIQGVQVESSDVYYYDQGNYEVDPVEGGYTLTYNLYDNETGAAATVTYDNNGKYFATVSDAKDVAASKADGFYTIGATDLKDYYVPTTGSGKATKSDTTYVVNDAAQYDEVVDNLFSALVNVGSIAEDTVIVDICNSGLTTISKIAKAIETQAGAVDISYSYDKNYNTAVLFVTRYNPDATQAPGASATNTAYDLVVSVSKNQDNKIVVAPQTLKDEAGNAVAFTSISKVVYTVVKDGKVVNVNGDVANVANDVINSIIIDSTAHTIEVTATYTGVINGQAVTVTSEVAYLF